MKEINDSVQEAKSKIEQAYKPIPIHRNEVTVTALKELKDNEEMVINHPHIKGLILKIRRDFKVETMLQLPVVFYGKKFIVSDTGDRVFPDHNVLLDENEMVSYIRELLTCKHSYLYSYYRSLKRHGLKEGDMIEVDGKKKGVVIIPTGDSFAPNIQFIPLKKDGTKSKQRPQILYGNVPFEKIGRYEKQ